METAEKIKLIKEILEDKKAFEIVAISIDKISSLGEYLIIASALNKRHVDQLGDHVEEALEKSGIIKLRREKSPDWYLLDYGDILINIFQVETREKYKLEDLWNKRIKE